MSKVILFGTDARKKLKEGIDIVANAVKVTMGYGGRTVIISNKGQEVRSTMDGVSVADEVELKDDIVNAGAKMTRELSKQMGDTIGDGTSTVTLIFQEIVSLGLTLIESGANPIQIKKGMEKAVKCIVEHLDKIKIDVTDNGEKLKQVALVSSHNDQEVADIVGDVFSKIGRYGIVSVEDSPDEKTTIELINGFQWDSGFYHDYLVNNEKGTCELNNPLVLLVDDKITNVVHIEPIMQKVAISKRALIIIADDFDNTVVATLHRNKSVFDACCVRWNYIGETKQELMSDLVALTGATLITEKKGRKIDKITIDDLGECEKSICTKTDTTILGGRKNQKELEKRIEDAKIKLEEAKNPFLKQRAERRLSKLSGSIAICKVGAMTEVERKEKKDRVDDAIRATKAAIEEGIVAGGGVALLRCVPELLKLKGDTPYEDSGITLVASAIMKPCYQINQNASGKGELIVEKLIDETGNIGWNVVTDKKEDLVASGIIDPKKVVRAGIENAVSAAAQVIISEALIIEE